MNRRAGLPINQLLPIHWLQIRPADVAEFARRFGADVVRDVAGVPDDYIVVADRFAVNEAVEVCFGETAKSAGGAVNPIVKLGAVIAKNPNVAARIGPIRRGRRDSIVRSRNNFVAFAGHRVLDPPLSFASWIAWALDLKILGVPV